MPDMEELQNQFNEQSLALDESICPVPPLTDGEDALKFLGQVSEAVENGRTTPFEALEQTRVIAQTLSTLAETIMSTYGRNHKKTEDAQPEIPYK